MGSASATAEAVIVTGVSTGIGRACAAVLVRKGFAVFGSVRSRTDASAFERDLGPAAKALIFDVTDEPSVREAAATVTEALAGRPLAGLVNNAGIAVAGPLEDLSLDRLRWQFEVNLTGVLCVVQAFLPLLRAASPAAKAGRIVNISSVAGRVPMPFTGPYAASKAGLDALSVALRRELVADGIAVSIVAPASVATPIWAKGEAEDISKHAGRPYAPALAEFRRIALATGQAGLPPETVGETVWRALTARRPRSRYLVTADRGLSHHIMRLLPQKLLDRLIDRRLRRPAGRS